MCCPTLPSTPAAAFALHTALVLSLAALTRLFVILHVLRHLPAGWLYTRGTEMRLLADSLLEGHGLSSPFGVPTGPTAIIAPAYPIFVAAVFRLTGSGTPVSAALILTIQLLVNVLTVWLVMRLARRLADHRSALIAGIFCACSLPLVWMPTILWDTSFSACLLLGFIDLTSTLKASSSRKRWCITGAFCALTGLINPALLPCLGAMGCLLAWRAGRQGLPKTSLALAAALVLFSPWPIRNALRFHAFVPTRTTVGLELWMGNHPGATGFLDESLFPTYNPAELADYIASGEVAYAAHKSALARQYIHAEPIVFAKITLLRLLRFWTGTGNSSGSLFFLLHATLTTLLGGTGMILLLQTRRRDASIFLLPILIFPLPYYLTHAEFRYRLVLDPLMAALSAVALKRLVQTSSSAKSDKLFHQG